MYVGGLLVLMAALVYASPLFAFLAIAAYAHAFTYLRGRWRFAAVGGAAVIVAYSQIGGRFTEITPPIAVGLGVLVVANTVVAGGFTYCGVFITTQSQRRRKVIAELNEANRRPVREGAARKRTSIVLAPRWTAYLTTPRARSCCGPSARRTAARPCCRPPS